MNVNVATAPTGNRVARFGRITYWTIAAIVAAIATIFLHEVAHFTAATLAGASDISFHWADVLHDTGSVSNWGNAFIAIAGPISTYTMLATGWWYSRNRTTPWALSLGFAAATRSLTLVPFTLRTLLGRDTSTFYFDEVQAATELGFSPLFLTIPGIMIGVFGMIYFPRQAKREGGWPMMLALIAVAIAGIALWGVVGPLLFPGGRGFS